MSLFFETIKIENATVQNSYYHNKRLNRTIKENFSLCPNYDIRDYIALEPFHERGIFRCKLLYDTEIREITITPYKRRKYNSFYCIASDMTYRYKSTDRSAIETLFAQKGSCDDIIILKDGLLTDTSIANIALFDGLHWYTPRTPLLEGTLRASLLAEKKIKTKDLDRKSLQKCTKFAIMNAMTGFYQLKDITFKF
jgi:4-amino-4-deoxychorismate lyase